MRDDMPRLRNGELSQTVRAIKDRAKYADQRAAARDVIMSTEPIGIKGGRQRPLDADPGDQGEKVEAQSYYCQYCRGAVEYGDARCDTCQEQLNWEGL